MTNYLPGSLKLSEASMSQTPSSMRSFERSSLVTPSSLRSASISPRAIVSPRSRIASASLGVPSLTSMKIAPTVVDAVHRVDDFFRFSGDVNILLDEVMEYINDYGDSNKLTRKLMKHEYKMVKMVLHRAIHIYMTRMEFLRAFIVLKKYRALKNHFLESEGLDTEEDLKEIMDEMIQKLEKHEETHEWIAKLKALFA